MIVLVMGVSGAGKTTVGGLLAEALGYEFADADAFHTAASRAKMSRGVPLDDADRAPWLDALSAAVDAWIRAGRSVVLACSALRRAHRARLLRGPGHTRLVYLAGSPELLRARLSRRVGHFAPVALLQSQLETLEAPDDAVTVDVAGSPEAIVRAILDQWPASSEADSGSR